MTSSVRLRGGSMEEIEIKFAVKDTKIITEKLRKLGFRVTVGRHLEKNYLLDDHDSKLKHREEIECRIEDADILLRMFEQSGFKIRTEYSKHRTVFEKNGFEISLDETEAGNYLEVEGPSDADITKLGEKLGYSETDFVRRTYAELIGEKRRG